MDKVNYIIDNLKKEVDTLSSSKLPKFIFIGGIPGAGKSLLIEKVKFDFSNDEFSVIEPDMYRKYFKDAKTVEDTVKETNKIELEILLYSLLKRKNIIHISSLRAFEYIDKLIKEKILPLEYEVYLYVIVTNKIDCSLSTYERYLLDKQNSDSFPRLNKFEYLEQANNGFDSAVKFFEKENFFKEVHIFKRGENMTLPNEIYVGVSDFANIVAAEENKQTIALDYEQIYSRISLIRKQLLSNNEKEEFDKVVNGIIYNYLDIGSKRKIKEV